MQSITALGVITLPILAPVVALLQILFPGLLGSHWKQYQLAIGVLMTQSTVMMLHWAAARWWVSERNWWVSEQALNWGMVVVAVVGALWALGQAPPVKAAEVDEDADEDEDEKPLGRAGDGKPVKIEYLAMGVFALLGMAWGVYLLIAGQSLLDQMAVVTLAALAGLGHVIYRKSRSAAITPDEAPIRPVVRLRTEAIFLWVMVFCGAGLAIIAVGGPLADGQLGAPIAGQWTMFRGNIQRTGVTEAASADAALRHGPTQPAVLWSFDGTPTRGRLMLHSTPTVVDDLVFIGGLYEIQALSQGRMYCINARQGRSLQDAPAPVASGWRFTQSALADAPAGSPGPTSYAPTSAVSPPGTISAGKLIWEFTASGTAKPIYSSPTVAGGRVYFGEGYHQDTRCRLFCLDGRRGDAAIWQLPTGSHVESSPTIDGDRLYVGAGDDGLLCVGMPAAGKTDAMLVWKAGDIHVDNSPLLADGKVIVGTVVGDLHKELMLAAFDAADGRPIWKQPAPLPAPGCAAFHDGAVYFGLGNGKVDHDDEKPAGAVWRLAAADGAIQWKYPVPGGVFGAPVVRDGKVIFTARDGVVRCISADKGEKIWERSIGEPITGSAVVTGEHVYTMTIGGVVACLKQSDGTEVWKLTSLKTPGNDAYGSPVLSGGRLYVAIGAKIHCIGQAETAR